MSVSDPVCFRLNNRTGFFAQLTDCVLVSKACDEQGVEPYFFVNSPISVQPGLSQNAISYFFDQCNLTREQQKEGYNKALSGSFVLINNRDDINLFARGSRTSEVANDLRTIEDGRRLFARNLKLRNWMAELADKFFVEHFCNGQCDVVGVHYRGKDKFGTEADAISCDQMLFEIENILGSRAIGGSSKIYLASDDPEFYAECVRRFGT